MMDNPSKIRCVIYDCDGVLFDSLDAKPCNAVWGDCDNDGRIDLFVSVRGSTFNVLFHNDGNGAFSRRPLGAAGDNVVPAWADYDNDGWLDLFLARGQGSAMANRLWHNNGDGTFTEITTGSIVTDLARSEGAAWGDYDNDGDLDVVINYENGSPIDLLLFLNDGSGGFTFGGFSAAVLSQYVYCADYDNDGLLDLYATGWNSRSRLYRNLGGGTFSEVLNEPPAQDVFSQWPQAGWGDYNKPSR